MASKDSPTAERTTIDGKGMSPEEGSSTTEFPTIEDCLSMASKDSPTAERTTIAEAPPITACSTFSTEAECLPMASTPDLLFPPCRKAPQSNLPICFTLAFHCPTVQCVCFFLSCSNIFFNSLALSRLHMSLWPKHCTRLPAAQERSCLFERLRKGCANDWERGGCFPR